MNNRTETISIIHNHVVGGSGGGRETKMMKMADLNLQDLKSFPQTLDRGWRRRGRGLSVSSKRNAPHTRLIWRVQEIKKLRGQRAKFDGQRALGSSPDCRRQKRALETSWHVPGRSGDGCGQSGRLSL